MRLVGKIAPWNVSRASQKKGYYWHESTLVDAKECPEKGDCGGLKALLASYFALEKVQLIRVHKRAYRLRTKQ